MFNYESTSVGDKYVLVNLESAFPPAVKKSEKARDAIIADMIANGCDPETADKQAKASVELYPDGELKAIKTPFYSFSTWLDRVTIRWLGGRGAGKLLSVHMLDKAEQKFAETQLKIIPLWQHFATNFPHLLTRLET